MGKIISLLQVPIVITVITIFTNLLVDFLKSKIRKSEIEKERSIPLKVFIIGNKQEVTYSKYFYHDFNEQTQSVEVELGESTTFEVDLSILNSSKFDSNIYNTFITYNNNSYLYNPRASNHLGVNDSLDLPIRIPAMSSINVTLVFDLSNLVLDSDESISLTLESTNGTIQLELKNFAVKYEGP